MKNYCSSHRLPRAGIDAITDDASALALIELLVAAPRRCEVVAVLLDSARRAFSVVSVTQTTDADAVHHVADVIVAAAFRGVEIDAVILASVRPGGGELDDVERWLTLDEQVGAAGIELVEWYVFDLREGSSVCRPRSLLGDPSRWVG